MLGQKLIKFCHCIFWKIKGTTIFFQSFLTFRNWPHLNFMSIMGCFYEFLCHFKLCLYLQGVSLILPLLFKAIWKGDTILMGHPVQCTWHTPFEYGYSVWSSYLHYWSQYTLDANVLLFAQIHITFSKNNHVGANLNKPFF